MYNRGDMSDSPKRTDKDKRRDRRRERDSDTTTSILVPKDDTPNCPSENENHSSLKQKPTHSTDSSLALLHSLMDTQVCVFEYFIDAVAFLGEDLPPLVSHKAHLDNPPNTNPPKLPELRQRCNLIRKFKTQARSLDEFTHVLKIFETIFGFVEDNLKEMSAYIRVLKEYYPMAERNSFNTLLQPVSLQNHTALNEEETFGEKKTDMNISSEEPEAEVKSSSGSTSSSSVQNPVSSVKSSSTSVPSSSSPEKPSLNKTQPPPLSQPSLSQPAPSQSSLSSTFSNFQEPFHVDSQTSIGLDSFMSFGYDKCRSFPSNDHVLMAHFIHLFFPATQFIAAADLLLNHGKWDKDASEAIKDKLSSDLMDIRDELNAEGNISFCKLNLTNYQSLYYQWATDETQYQLFRTSILKELSFNPELNEQYELNYENSILRRILDKELNSSPHSFNDDECKVLDAMEIVTFHLDSFDMVATLVSLFHVILTAKTSPTSAEVFSRHKALDNLLQYLASEVKSTMLSLIDGGTVGLSNRDTFHYTLSVVVHFKQLLWRYVGSGLSVPKSNLFFKEEYHFFDVLHKYVDSLELLTSFISDAGDTTVIIDEKKDEFEELDSTVKDCFFDLAYFTQRFTYEKEISELVEDRRERVE